MIVSFTGTRHGVTPRQYTQLLRWLDRLGATAIRHGNCIGADATADTLAVDFGLWTYVHPSDQPLTYALSLATLRRRVRTTVYPEAPPLTRNRDIVTGGDGVLIAVTRRDVEEQRSGTWATIRFARARHYRVIRLGPTRTEEEMP